jgi:hypothetical protein
MEKAIPDKHRSKKRCNEYNNIDEMDFKGNYITRDRDNLTKILLYQEDIIQKCMPLKNSDAD